MPHYDLVIIGSGSGNSIIDERFDDWRIALIDDGVPFGGTCLNKGCIPTKMFVVPADYCRLPAAAARVNVQMQRPVADFAGIRDRVFGRIDPIAAGGETWRDRAPNVDLYRETARFDGPRSLVLSGGERVTADRVVLAAGSRAVLPVLPGLDAPDVAARVHTSDSIMRLPEQPRRLAILGGGFIAAEFAHVFSALGTDVTVINRSDRLLRREDEEIACRYTAQAERDVNLLPSTVVTSVSADADGLVLDVTCPAGQQTVRVDTLLVATGRVPNGDRLDAPAGGVELDASGYVVVDPQQRTTADGVWALGDVCSPVQLKHVANRQARVVQHNLLHPDDAWETDSRAIPHAVFGHPTVASVGLTEADARAAGLDVRTVVQEYGSVAYGWALEDTVGCCKLVGDAATGRLLGAHIIGHEADVLLQPLIQGMVHDIGVEEMARAPYWIHPSLTELVENALLALVREGVR